MSENRRNTSLIWGTAYLIIFSNQKNRLPPIFFRYSEKLCHQRDVAGQEDAAGPFACLWQGAQRQVQGGEDAHGKKAGFNEREVFPVALFNISIADFEEFQHDLYSFLFASYTGIILLLYKVDDIYTNTLWPCRGGCL